MNSRGADRTGKGRSQKPRAWPRAHSVEAESWQCRLSGECGSLGDNGNGKGIPGAGVRPAEPTGAQGPGESGSEVGLVFLQLHHEVMDVDELRPGRERAQLGLGQHPVEAVVQLDQLRQRPLQGRVGQTRGHGTVRASPASQAQLLVALQGGGVCGAEPRGRSGKLTSAGLGQRLGWPVTWMMLVPFRKLVKLRMTS